MEALMQLQTTTTPQRPQQAAMPDTQKLPTCNDKGKNKKVGVKGRAKKEGSGASNRRNKRDSTRRTRAARRANANEDIPF